MARGAGEEPSLPPAALDSSGAAWSLNLRLKTFRLKTFRLKTFRLKTFRLKTFRLKTFCEWKPSSGTLLIVHPYLARRQLPHSLSSRRPQVGVLFFRAPAGQWG